MNKTLSWNNQEPFRGTAPMPATAPVTQDSPAAPLRTVMPSGPSPPNAKPTPQEVVIPERTVPNDPMDDVNSPTPLRDNLRHPENSFGPGTPNSGTQVSLDAGISSKTVNSGVSQFSPEFAQNGGEFMAGIQAADTFGGDNYASI